MKLLDLFCGAGGASMGYYWAGFNHIVGVDIKKQPDYPFEFIQGDALEYLIKHGLEYDFIHASPPCQAYVDTNSNGKKKSNHPRLIEPTRELLKQINKPWIIENIPGSPIRHDLMLCGTMFNLRVIRHRYFEMSFVINKLPPPCNHWGTVASGDFMGVYGRGGKGHRHGKGIRDAAPKLSRVSADEAMGIDWMDWKELTQAIPPAYTKWIGSSWIEND